MITTAKLGWMAAVIDLRGHLVFKQNKERAQGSRQIVLVVDSKLPGVVRELCTLTGTKAEAKIERKMREFMRRSCNEHCPEAHIHVNDERVMPGIYRWTITGMGLAIILESLLPLFVEEKGFQEIQEEILDGSYLSGQGSGAVMATVNRLRVLGWELPEKVAQELERRRLAMERPTGEEDEQRQHQA